MIEVRGLTKLYGDLVATEDLSFDVAPGEILGLVGPNGAGKTTTLRILAGILPPTRGDIRISGHDLRADPVSAKASLAFFPDEPRLFDHLTVQEHLAFMARIYRVADAESKGRELLREMELEGKEKALPGELSRGMKQKLALACGLLHDPRVLLFDEPLTGLDPFGIRRIKQSILQRARGGASAVVSSHLLPLVQELCTRVLVIRGGKKLLHGSLAEIRTALPHLPQDADLEEIFIRVAHDEGPGETAK